MLTAKLVRADEVLTIEHFLKEAQSQSLDIAVEQATTNASEARAEGIRLPAPMVGLMRMKSSMGSSDGIEASQEIPFPTKIYKEKKVRSLEFDAQKQNNFFQREVILANARSAYLDFWGSYERLRILKEKKNWLDRHVKVSRATTRSDSSAQVHFLEIESDADLAENDILSQEADVLEKRSALKIYAPTLKIETVIPKEPALIEMEIHNTASDSPYLAVKQKDLLAKQAFEDLKKQSYLPDIFVRLRSYNNNPQMPFLGQEVMVGISVPFIYFWQPSAEVAEARAQTQRAQVEFRKATIEFETKTLSLVMRAQAIEKQLKVLKGKLLPRAERRMKLVKNLSQRTMEGLNEHNAVVIAFLDLQMQAVELRENYEKAFTELLKISGSKQGTEKL